MTVIAVIAAAGLAVAAPAAPNPAAVPAPPPASAPQAPAPPQAPSADSETSLPDIPDAAPLGSDDHGPTIRAAYDAAESRQGPLDGRWRLTDQTGAVLFIFQLNDPGLGPKADAGAVTEGAWRDPNLLGLPDSSGFLDQIDRDGETLSIRFREHDGDPPCVVLLKAGPNGQWRGALSGPGARERVVMSRF